MALSPTPESVDTAVRAFVAAGSGIDPQNVIPGDDNGPRPNVLYATVKPITDITVGVPQEVYRAHPTSPDTMVNVHISSWQTVDYSIQFYRTGARAAAKQFRLRPHNPEGRRILAQAGLVWRNASDITNVNAVIASKFEERVALTAQFRYTETIDPQAVNAVNSVQFILKGTAEEDFEETKEITDQ